MASPGASPPSRGNAPPHIRLNSATDNMLVEDLQNKRPSTARQSSSRSLIPSRPGTAHSSGLRSPPSGSELYNQPAHVADSAELLLPPKKMRTRRFRDESPAPQSPSGMSSRRTSWSSESSVRDSRHSPFASPFDDSRAPSRAGSDDELNTQTVSEKYNILPSAGLLLFPEDVEKDDWLHNPDPNEKEKRDCDVFSRRGIVNVGGLVLISLGVLLLFIGYPILTFVHKLTSPTVGPCTYNPLCVDVPKVPLLKNLRTGLVDPDTPDSVMSRKSHDGTKQNLVFSDEFNTDGRTFYDGDDPYFQAVDIWYGVTQDLEWYDPDAVTTKNGYLNIQFDAFKNHGLNYRSGMLQSWNKLCFKGGHMEASISLPGRGDTVGFWPGFWAMGNLGRPGYAATTDGMWPYSYDDVCDAGITPNQSSTDGISYLPGMRLPACTCAGEDHPNPGTSRSAPEIDAVEATVGNLDATNMIGMVSQSFQSAPFDIWYRADTDFMQINDYSITSLNSYQGGPFQQAISVVTHLNNDWYDGKEYQKYAFDYKTGDDGYITWHVGDAETWTMDARAIGKNGNIGKRVIPEEPLALIVNFGMSNGFSAINLTGIGSTLPATMRLDYIRIYQDEGNELMTCDPPGYETTGYIEDHPEPYSNPNLTLWKATKYDWPKNSLMNDCKM